MSHLYPQEFAEYVFRQLNGNPSTYHLDYTPDRTVLENILSICYQASLMREEERPARFRMIIRSPESFPLGQSPPDGLHRFVFTKSRECSEDELRRLFPAVSFHRSMIGVTIKEDSVPHIWGVVHTGPRWLQLMHGGTLKINPWPDSLIIFVTGPGRITVSVGLTMIAAMRGGKLITAAMDVLSSRWLKEFFSENQEEMWEMHRDARRKSGVDWAPIAPEFPMILAQNLMRRVISLICNYRHGGTLVILPMGFSKKLEEANSFLNIKYRFSSDTGIEPVYQHIARIMNEFAQVGGESGNRTDPLGWNDYQSISTPALSRMDEMLFEKAHLLAELTLVDGAVVLNRRFELLGFGAEITGGLETVTSVRRAIDIEGVNRQPESVSGVGTRHRSAYRLCETLHGALVVVVSQDGQVRFVRRHDSEVTYWDQMSTRILDF